MQCPHCHHPVHDADTYCSYCGKRIRQKPQDHSWYTDAVWAFLLSCVFVFAMVLLHRFSANYPKGMYVYQNANGEKVAQLSIRSNGTYELIDNQDYTQQTETIFYHDFKITSSGLTWPLKQTGKITPSSYDRVYTLKGFFDGLYGKAKDATMVLNEETVYLYETDDPDNTIVLRKLK